MPVSAGAEDAIYGQSLSLNVYLDHTGKALVTGYVENVAGLDFLNTSEYRFENDTRQLYALTDGLTTKLGDLWTLRFNALGSFDDYRVTFYLPGDMRVGSINASDGLGYLLSASNESLVADVQGYEVSNPAIAIEYQQPRAATSGLSGAIPPGNSANNSDITMFLAASLLKTRGKEFWDYHKRALEELGYPLKTPSLIKAGIIAVFQETLNPGQAVGKCWRILSHC